VGTLSSGNYSPVLGHGIGMGLLEPGLAPGQPVTIMLRGREIDASVTALPFVQKES
jgi:aminomethyltransferase